MKKSIFLTALTAVMAMASCQKNESIPAPSMEKVELSIGVQGAMPTKATTWTAENEVKSNNLQVFVFRGGELDAYGSADNVTQLTLQCTAGQRTVYALVNAPDYKAVETESDLLAKVSQLSNNTLSNFEMFGKKEVALPGTKSVVIDVERVVARVKLSKISRDFASPALASQTFTVNKIYLVNASKDVNYGHTVQPTGFYNLHENLSEMAELLVDAPAVSIADQQAYTPAAAHQFYTYPNDLSTETTRLVIEATLGTNKYYYPINLPALESNKSYNIENITIKRPGSDDPNVPVQIDDITFSIHVVDWVAVPVTDGTTI